MIPSSMTTGAGGLVQTGAADHAGHVHPLRSLVTVHRELLWEMTKRDFAERYARHWLGTVWVVAHPLFLMGLYLLVFAVIFKPQLQSNPAMSGDYAAFLLAGLVPWLTFQEAMNRSCGSIVGQAGLVKQVVFPLHVLPAAQVLAAGAGQVISLAALVAYLLIKYQGLPATWALLPILAILQVCAMLGVGFMLAAISVYLRDLKEVVLVFGAIGIYLMPVFYPVEWAPAAIRVLLYLNPFTYMTWCYQDALSAGRFDHPAAWVLYPLLSFGMLFIGSRMFDRMKAYFGSVL